MNGQEIKSALKRGENAFGTLVASTSPKWLDYIKDIGMDFVFIDTEHMAIDREILSWMCHAYGTYGLAPVVRIPSPDPYLATQVIDGGASGILAPYIETVEQVKLLVGEVKYLPVKGDKLNGEKEFESKLEIYLNEENINNMLFINIESIVGIEALDEILQIPEVDGIVIGSHDLSCSLGIPEDYDNPIFDAAVRNIFVKCREHNKGAGIHFFGNIDREIS